MRNKTEELKKEIKQFKRESTNAWKRVHSGETVAMKDLHELDLNELKAELKGRQEREQEILDLWNKGLSKWFEKWHRKVITGRCLIELKHIPGEK